MIKKPVFSKINLRESYHFTAISFSALLATFFFLPVALLLPKKKGRCAVIGRERGTFTDNCKHFYLYILKNRTAVLSVTFISSSKQNIAQLHNHSLPCLFYPGLKALYWLLTAEFVIMDSAEWIGGGKFHLASGAKTIQLWHGAPLKEIELPLHNKRLHKLCPFPRFLLQIQKKMIGRYPEYYAVITTSNFFTRKAFASAFKAEYFLEYGYPRNDAILKAQEDIERLSPLWINCDHKTLQKIDAARKNQLKIFLYAPTFRSDLSSPFTEHLSLEILNNYGATHGILFIMKLHPLMAGQARANNFSHILHYDPAADVYPVLHLMDCLITVYSSIYFDYLFLDRPIIFFPYDFHQYVTDERTLLFDYAEMAPGPICYSQEELKAALSEPDTEYWQNRRKKVRDKVFDHFDDQAGTRLLNFLVSDEQSS